MLAVLAFVLAVGGFPSAITTPSGSQIADPRSQISKSKTQISGSVTDSVSALPSVKGAESFLMPAVTIVERRGFDPLTGAGSSIDVRETRSQMQTPGELLGREAGVTVRRSGGLYQGVSIRGGASNQAQLFLNGTPLPSSIGGSVSVSMFPLDALERMEIYRGSLPVRFLRSPLSGGVNVVTLQPTDAPSGFRLATGSFGSHEASLFAAAGNSETGILAGGSSRSYRGDFTFENHNGTPGNPTDDYLTQRSNNDAAAGDVFVIGQHQSEHGRVDAHIVSAGANQGLPGFGFAQAERARLDSRISLAGATWTRAHDDGTFAASAFGGQLRERFHDPRGELTVPNTNTLNVASQGGARINEQLTAGRWRPDFSLEYEFLKFSTETLSADLPTYNRQRLAAGAGTTWQYENLTLLVSAQGEYNRLTANDVQIVGQSTGGRRNELWLPAARLGAAYELHSSLSVLANTGTGYRVPSAQEQFGDRGFQIGNPDLRPETAVYGDIGVQWLRETRAAAWSIDVRYFRQTIKDIIGVYQTTPKTASAVNFQSALAAGYELTATGTWKNVRAGLNGSYTAIANTGPVAAYNGNQLPGRPLWEIGSELSYRHRYFEPFYELDVQGPYFLDPVNTAARRVDRRFYHTAGLTVTPHPDWRLTGTARNIGDERSYDFIGYPLPGRGFTAVVQFTTY